MRVSVVGCAKSPREVLQHSTAASGRFCARGQNGLLPADWGGDLGAIQTPIREVIDLSGQPRAQNRHLTPCLFPAPRMAILHTLQRLRAHCQCKVFLKITPPRAITSMRSP